MRKIFILGTIAALIFGNSIGVNAQAESIDESVILIDNAFVDMISKNPEELYKQFDNIENIQEVVINNDEIYAEAYEILDEDITALPCDATLNKVSLNRACNILTADSSFETSTIYILSASTTKTSSNTLAEDGVTLKGYIIWEDILGPVNNFKSASGSRSGAYNENGNYMVLRHSTPLCSGTFDTSFYATSDLDDTTGTGFQLIINTKTTKGSSLQLRVKTLVTD